jgi:hypothetical protein
LLELIISKLNSKIVNKLLLSVDYKGELPERHLSLLFDTTAYRALALDAHTTGLWCFVGGAVSWTAVPVAAAPVGAALVAAGPGTEKDSSKLKRQQRTEKIAAN